jgi:hypothetical protein
MCEVRSPAHYRHTICSLMTPQCRLHTAISSPHAPIGRMEVIGPSKHWLVLRSACAGHQRQCHPEVLLRSAEGQLQAAVESGMQGVVLSIKIEHTGAQSALSTTEVCSSTAIIARTHTHTLCSMRRCSCCMPSNCSGTVAHPADCGHGHARRQPPEISPA